MSRKFKCDRDCEIEKSSVWCLARMLSKLIKESVDVMECVARYDYKQMRIEMSDVMVVIEGLKQYHPSMCGEDRKR